MDWSAEVFQSRKSKQMKSYIQGIDRLLQKWWLRQPTGEFFDAFQSWAKRIKEYTITSPYEILSPSSLQTI